jgi:nicotinamidase-related amidase
MYFGDRADVLKVRMEAYLKGQKAKGNLIFGVREVHHASDTFYRRGKSHSVVGSHDVDIPEAFKPYLKLVVNATRPSAFFATMLESELRKAKPEAVHVVGMETHMAVLFTAEELRNRDYEVVVPEALTSSQDEYLQALGINLLANSLSVVVQ